MDRRRQQASKIAAWVGTNNIRQRGAHLKNASEVPVYRVEVAFSGILPDGATYSDVAKLDVLPPTEELRFLPATPRQGDLPEALHAAVSFRDAHGYRWT